MNFPNRCTSTSANLHPPKWMSVGNKHFQKYQTTPGTDWQCNEKKLIKYKCKPINLMPFIALHTYGFHDWGGN